MVDLRHVIVRALLQLPQLSFKTPGELPKRSDSSVGSGVFTAQFLAVGQCTTFLYLRFIKRKNVACSHVFSHKRTLLELLHDTFTSLTSHCSFDAARTHRTRALSLLGIFKVVIAEASYVL